VKVKVTDRVLVGLIAFVTRWFVVFWAAKRIPPAADGSYYHILATRIADGQGYTWLWPDGAVTYAAHYPVGYPALIAGPYAMFGAKPALAMAVNALLGILAALAVYDMLVRVSSRELAFAGGIAMALHPALLPYTAALMTEGVTASLLVVVAACADRARRSPRWIVVAGLLLGVATLVRPQSLVLAPFVGLLAVPFGTPLARRLSFAAGVTILALAVCAPWTARNCRKMDRCALVSVNGGWNLAIGTQTKDGGWAAIDVPEACKTVFQEAEKDSCFGREALSVIRAHPGAWLARVPAKLRVTFDYHGAASWYLHTANASAFPFRAKVGLGVLETIAVRLLLALAIVAGIRAPGSAGDARLILGALGIGTCLLVPGALAYLTCSIVVLLLGVRSLTRAPVFVALAPIVILTTAATHAVFFGSGRYGLVVLPFVTALAFYRSADTRATPG
jgi:4-amino-4-deoxy-L-arabinose transferase-like glycosyltransferase